MTSMWAPFHVADSRSSGIPSRRILPALALLCCLTKSAEARSRRASSDDALEFETTSDYAWAFLKVGLACSPIIAIGLMLACAREDEETESAKKEAAKNSKSCKS
mmetsp:Transcript_39044/g.117347  ORF Transcript_39044/g.117347 Transcript_39044/m.117347 type:complete len:105 (-) Transcript_39044:1023-1337(-)